jgi:putative restriction endonuclease
MLSLLDLIEQGVIQVNLIELTPDLMDLFKLYWTLVMSPERRGNLAMPFYHMKSEGFWTLLPKPGQESALQALTTMTSLGQVRSILLGAQLNDELFELLQSSINRGHLRTLLISTYFSQDVQRAVLEQAQMNQAAFEYSRVLFEKAKGLRDATQSYDVPKKPVRDQGFRRVVVAAYAHRCTLCGIRMRTADGHTVVDAAHIVPWSVSHNDDPGNGLALCRLCHWTFDKGLIGISRKYRIITSTDLLAGDNLSGDLAKLGDRSIFTPEDQDLWPKPEALAWHRKEHGLR